MSRFRSLVIASSTVAAALVALAIPATTATASAIPRIGRADVAAPAVGGSNDYLGSDSCTSSTFCMAIGAYHLNGRSLGLSEMLSGGNWVAESVPSPSHGVNVFANEVSCSSPASCLFVGEHWATRSGSNSNLAEAWKGSSWHIVTAKGPAGSGFSGLDDVACPTTTFCLAIGFAGTGSHYQDTAYTWKNGTSWRRIAVPNPSGARNSELGGLACYSPRNCMAVGNYRSASGLYLPFAAHWRDGQWNLLATPAVRRQRATIFQGISCPTATRCVAVGNTTYDTHGSHAFAEVWSGGTWHISTVRRSQSAFVGASCPAWNRCFASGYTFPSGARSARPLIEAWGGLNWTTQQPVQTAAPRSGDVLQHVSCVTRSFCEAVGYSYVPGVSTSDKTLAELWNGHRWVLQATVNP